MTHSTTRHYLSFIKISTNSPSINAQSRDDRRCCKKNVQRPYLTIQTSTKSDHRIKCPFLTSGKNLPFPYLLPVIARRDKKRSSPVESVTSCPSSLMRISEESRFISMFWETISFSLFLSREGVVKRSTTESVFLCLSR